MPLSPNYAAIWKVIGCALRYERYYKGKLLCSEDAHAICNAVSPQPISLELFETAVTPHGDDSVITPVIGFGDVVVAENSLDVFYIRKKRRDNKRLFYLGVLNSASEAESAEVYTGIVSLQLVMSENLLLRSVSLAFC
jgi:hypothetical protein